MSDILKEFLVSVGFKVDATAAAKVQGAVDQSEAKLTASTRTALEQRRKAEDKALADRVNAIVSVNGELDAEEKAAAARFLKTHKDQTEKDQKLKDEAAKKDKERRDAMFKNIQATALKIAATATGLIVGVGAAATGIVAVVDKASKQFESLGYASQRMGGSVKNVTAFAYGIGQLGGSADAASASLERLGQHLKQNPAGFEGLLKSLGVQTRDAAGNLRDSAALATDALQALRAKPYATAKNYADTLGIDDDTLRAGMDPRLPGMEAQRKADQAKIGTDPDRAAAIGSAFEIQLRKLEAVLADVADKILANFSAHITPWLEHLSAWVTEYGAKLTDGLTGFTDSVINLAVTFTKYLGSDDFKKDVKSFTEGLASLARFIRSALQAVGILPTRAEAAEGGGGLSAVQQGELGTMRAAYRGRKEIPQGTREKAGATLDRFKRGQGVDDIPSGPAPGASGYGLTNAPYTRSVDKKGENGVLSPRELYNHFKAQGASDNEAMMLTSAAGSESSFNPNAVHDGGSGHGLWGHNDGRLNMRGRSWQEQADAALKELRGRAEHAAVERAKTPEELADAEMYYERPRGFSSRNPRAGDNYTGRLGTIKRFSNAFGNRPAPIAPPTANPFGAIDPGAFKAPPLGVTPSMYNSYDNSRNRGNTTVNAPQTFNIQGGDVNANMRAARLAAGRGGPDWLRNLQGAEA